MPQRLTAGPISAGDVHAQANMVSIARIPPYFISHQRRAILLRRAGHGADVRAWVEWTPPDPVGIWWLWDGEDIDPNTGLVGRHWILGRERL